MLPSLPMLLAGATLALAQTALAQDRPVVVPTRDVAVTYRAASGADGGEIRIAWLSAAGLMRVDMPGGQGWMLMDTRAGTGVLVMDAQRLVMDLPPGASPAGMVPSASARFTREGTARVANLDCVNWRIEDRDQAGRACLTADGVMLRAEGAAGGAQGRLEATAVSYGPQDRARFQRPAGYQSLQMPGQAPGRPPAAGAPIEQGLPRGTALPPPGLTMPPR